ncbi:LPXTG cell wall anchor domain-containing protein [Paractinoplanes rhizophilus]|jgi:LPXTG-motif cell wall-anchored protein|uniref:LPXTG cell wall anchor domain-containing protein n=1 Tax=Paractinoplanes rhizophilus TaxID=1416877 RepID=A0ABW2HS02_9ACTN|nr:LPXTG cell wall anchor domain-containing protein [Actinoplanes sp.]
MRWKTSAGVLIALAFLIPATPAMARTDAAGLDSACHTVERRVFKDIRELVTIDLDTATDVQIRLLANQIQAEAKAESLPVLPDEVQERLDGTADELRAFLKTGMPQAWTVALRVEVVRTLTDAGANVNAEAQKVLDAGTVDTYLTYLNDGLYAARALDCASQPTAPPPVTPTATKTAAPIPASPTGAATSSAASGTAGGEGGGLPVTGSNIGAVAGIGGALLLLGGAGYLIGRRRRSRFVA